VSNVFNTFDVFDDQAEFIATDSRQGIGVPDV